MDHFVTAHVATRRAAVVASKLCLFCSHKHNKLLPLQPELALASMERALALSPGHAEAAAELAELRVLVLRRRAGGTPGGRRMQVGEAGMPQVI